MGKQIVIGNVVPGNRGIKPEDSDQYYEFDEENSEYDNKQMSKFLKKNIDEGDKVELTLSTEKELHYTKAKLKEKRDTSQQSGSDSYSGGDDSSETIPRQKAFAEVREWFSETGHDPAEMSKEEYMKFWALVRDAKEFIEEGDFDKNSHFLVQLLEDGDMDRDESTSMAEDEPAREESDAEATPEQDEEPEADEEGVEEDPEPREEEASEPDAEQEEAEPVSEEEETGEETDSEDEEKSLEEEMKEAAEQENEDDVIFGGDEESGDEGQA